MFKRLIKLVRQEKVSLFIGAGFSIEASAPSVSVIKEEILADIDDEKQRELHASDGLAELSEYYVEEVCAGSRNSLISMMSETFKFTPTCMDDHKMMANIPHFKKIFTTNYDTLLEDSYKFPERVVVRTDKDCAYEDGDKTIVCKVHGDFTDPDSVVITTSDYNKYKRKKPQPQMWHMIEQEFLHKHILFVGYSLEDDNILEIIKDISKSVDLNQKDMFLIAPNISQQKRCRLKKMHITCLDAHASDFLKTLTKELDENISDDFRHGDISAETYARYCHSHNYEPNVTVTVDGENKINEPTALPGAQLLHQVQFTVPMEFKDRITQPDFEKNGEYCDHFEGGVVPCFRLSGTDLIKCSHLINGIVFNKDIKELYIGPAGSKFDFTIQIPSRDFYEFVEGKCFKLNNQNLLITANCKIFTLTIVVGLGDSERKTVNFRFDFLKTYKDNNEASKWIDVPLAFFSKEDLIIKQISACPFNIGSNHAENIVHNFNEFKQYYSDIREIERRTGKKFTRYNECSEESYKMARKVVSYLKHEYLPESCGNELGVEFSTKDIPNGDFLKQVKEHEEITVVSTKSNPLSLSINDRTFKVPYTHCVFNGCEINKLLPTSDGMIQINFRYHKPVYHILYSDKPIDVEYPGLRQLKNELSDFRSISATNK